MSKDESGAPLISMGKLIKDLEQMSQAGIVMVLAARLEQSLEWILEGNMVPMPKEVRGKLFEGYGPLHSFSAKIDLCFAFGHITKDQRKTLLYIKAIRNFFAHSDDIVHFEHEDFQSSTKLKANPLKVNEQTYRASVKALAGELQQEINKAFLIKAVRYHKTKEANAR
ncbi:hypothetical protein [Rhizobium mongolense]